MTHVEIRGHLKRVEVADVEIYEDKTKGVILSIADWDDPYVPTAQLRLVFRDGLDWAELRQKLEDL